MLMSANHEKHKPTAARQGARNGDKTKHKKHAARDTRSRTARTTNQTTKNKKTKKTKKQTNGEQK